MPKPKGPPSEKDLETLGGKALLKKIMAQEQGIFLAISPDWRVLDVSCGSEKVWGFQSGELNGLNFLDLIHPEDRLRVRELIETARNGKFSTTDARCLGKNGNPIRLLWKFVRSTPEQMWCAMAREFMKRAPLPTEIVVLEELELFKKALDEHAIVAITDAKGKITYQWSSPVGLARATSCEISQAMAWQGSSPSPIKTISSNL